MPIPRVVAGAYAGVVALADGGAAISAKRFVGRFRGKSVLLVGPQFAGKTTLAALLGDDSTSLVVASDQKSKQKSKQKLVNLSQFKLKTPQLDLTDAPDDETVKTAIRDRVPKANLVCLVVSLERLEGNSPLDDPLRLAKQVAQCSTARTKSTLVLTHLGAAGFRDSESVLADVRVAEIKVALGATDVLIGNLLDKNDRTAIAARIIGALT